MLKNVDIISFTEAFSKFSRIKFSSTGHLYSVDGKETPLSVTRLINIFLPKFERDKIAAAVAKKTKSSVDNIIKEWEFEKDIACIKGSIFHNYIDNYLANKICNSDFTDSDALITNPIARIDFRDTIDKLKGQFTEYYNNEYSKKYIHLKSEFIVGDLDASNVCGTIDNLSINKETGNLAILDYNTNKKIDTVSKYNNSLIPPLDHLKQTKLVTYSLQIGIYKYIIEKHTPYKVDTGQILWFNEKNTSYQIFDVLNLDSDVSTMFNCYNNYCDHVAIEQLDCSGFD